jgi:2'-5' RNA ligase
MGIRSFLAFRLPFDIRSVLDEVLPDLKGASRDVKWVRPGGVHLTVVFLGDIEEGTLTDLKESVKRVADNFTPFDVAVRGTGFFPNPRRPRVVWLGLEGDIERMGGLRNDLQRALKPFGIKQEKRAFKPHLTLGRFRRGGSMDKRLENTIAKFKDVSSPVCTLGELILFKSDLRPGGAVYTVLEEFPLAGK